MVAADIVIAVVWVAFWLYWLTSAVTAKSANRAGRGAYVGMRVALIVAVFLLLRLHVFRGRVLPDTPWLLALGLLLFFGGLGLVWARVYIGRSQFPATYPAYKRSTKMLIPYIL
jgi:hypothetical protein